MQRLKRMFEYGFEENSDFTLLKNKKPIVHNKKEYALTLDCAKEISMLQRTIKQIIYSNMLCNIVHSEI